eukprot:545677_1
MDFQQANNKSNDMLNYLNALNSGFSVYESVKGMRDSHLSNTYQISSSHTRYHLMTNIQLLEDMGFDSQISFAALSQSYNNIDTALQHIMQGMVPFNQCHGDITNCLHSIRLINILDEYNDSTNTR